MKRNKLKLIVTLLIVGLVAYITGYEIARCKYSPNSIQKIDSIILNY